MFIGRSMKDDIWSIFSKDVAHPISISNIRDRWNNSSTGVSIIELSLNPEKAGFTSVKYYKFLGPMFNELPAKFRANTA
jgi:hypothetical protein